MVARKMKTTPAVTFMKILLGVFTAILWVIGACFLGSGIYTKTALGSYDTLISVDISSAPYVMIGIGIFIIFVGFFGFFAICKENSCMLKTYGFCLGILFLAEIISAITVVVLRSDIQALFEKGMTAAVTNYTTNDEYKKAVDQAQSQLDCCGSENYTDYWRLAKFDVNSCPSSCCKSSGACANYTSESDKNILINLPENLNETSTLIFVHGCPTKVSNAVQGNLGAILGAMFGIAAFQLIGLFLSCCLASSINANKYELV